VSDIQPISKRSRRLLEEAQRHLVFARRGIDRLSLDEYKRLASIVFSLYPTVDLAILLQGLQWLARSLQDSLDRGD
jgi:hypothetical protein